MTAVFPSAAFFDRRFYRCRFIPIVFATAVLAAFHLSLKSVLSFFGRFFVSSRQPLTAHQQRNAWIEAIDYQVCFARRITSEADIGVNLIATIL